MQFDCLPESDHPLVGLRPIAQADLPVWSGILSQPRVYEQTSWNHPTVDDLAPYVWQEATLAPAGLLRFAIALRSSNELVGTIGFHTVVPVNRSAELAYDLAPEAWGKGIATQLSRLIVQWAHRHAGIFRVQATVLESNVRSARVLERAGFAHEGLLHAYRLVRGVPGNFHMYSHVELPGDAV
jgi:ribosomal-protein-alanine N-acetyltransferase